MGPRYIVVNIDANLWLLIMPLFITISQYNDLLTFQDEMLDKLKKYDALLEVEVELRYVISFICIAVCRFTLVGICNYGVLSLIYKSFLVIINGFYRFI